MDVDTYLRFVLALLLVLALIAVLAWLARRFGFGGHLVPSAGKSPRLTILEVKTLDSRRRLILVRRDTREHLLLLGPGNDLHIESNAPREAAATSGLADAVAPAASGPARRRP